MKASQSIPASQSSTSKTVPCSPPPPRMTQQAFQVNPSPHEIAVGSLEQWRRSKLSKAWKNVLVSIVKQNSNISLCVWREVISSSNGLSSVLELLQQIPLSLVSYINIAEHNSFCLSITHAVEEVTFRCLEEPEAAQDWVTTLRTVCSHMSATTGNSGSRQHHQAPQQVDLLSFDPPAPNTNTKMVQQSWEQQLMAPHLHVSQGQAQTQFQQKAYLYAQQQQKQVGGQTNNSQAPPYACAPAHQHHQQKQQPDQNYSKAWAQSFVQQPSSFPTQQHNNNRYQHPNQQRAVTPPPRPTPTTEAIPRPAAGSKHHSSNYPRQQQQSPHHTTPTRSFSAPLPPKQQTTSQRRQDQIKKQVLLEWALQPPGLQQLRPLPELLGTIHGVLPPRFTAVQNHVYFAKWDASTCTSSTVNRQDDIQKVLRKLKFLLHPDKLPKDFKEDQSFLCKMLWDIINDAHQLALQGR